jgi:hypothetical protein
MRRLVSLSLLVALLAAAPAHAGAGKRLCVGGGHGCYASIQAALDAAHDGDTIAVGPGSFAGGIRIEKSVHLVGAGAWATAIRGGGPVVSIGRFLAKSEPTVSIARLTISGGLTTSSPISKQSVGKDGVIAAGGGVEIYPAAGFATGATVTISDSVITRNRVAPSATVPSGSVVCPGGGQCPFAAAKGGGIDSWGSLTLTNTTVSDNTVAGVASDANGGGVNVNGPGTLTLIESDVSDNSAVVVPPNGRFAEGGGIFTADGAPLTMHGGSVTGNEARLTSRLPYFVPGADPLDMNANGGGIHTGTDSDVVVDGVRIAGNLAGVSDPNGEPYAFDSGMETSEGPAGVVKVTNSRIEDNRVVADVGSAADVGPSGEALDVDGPVTVSDTLIRRNSVSVTSRDGTAAATGAVYVGPGESAAALITRTAITDNESHAASAHADATVQGAGLVNDGRLRLSGVLVAGNSGSASGPSGFARGGGIWNDRLFNEDGPIELALERTTVTHNRLAGGKGIAVEGGGIFTSFPVSLVDSQVTGNLPDQCRGC